MKVLIDRQEVLKVLTDEYRKKLNEKRFVEAQLVSDLHKMISVIPVEVRKENKND